MDQANQTPEQQEKAKASDDRMKIVQDVKNKLPPEEKFTEEGNAPAILSNPHASNGVPTVQLKARIEDHVPEAKRQQAAMEREKVEEELPRVPSPQDETGAQVTDLTSRANTTASLHSHDQAGSIPSGKSAQPSSQIAAAVSHPGLNAGAGIPTSAAAIVQTNNIRPPNPNPSEGDSFHPELPMVVWVHGRWCELACPDASCKTNGPVNKKTFFIDISALRDHVIRSHKGIVKLSLTIPAERRTFLQSCVQRRFDAADVQRLSQGRDPVGGPIKRRMIRDKERAKETQARHGNHDQSTPTLSGGEMDANIADNSVIEPQNSMKTVSDQSGPIYGKMTGDYSIPLYSDRSGQPITIRYWEDFDAYMAASKGSNLTTSYSDQSGPLNMLRTMDDLDAYMAASKGSNLTNSRNTLDSNRPTQSANSARPSVNPSYGSLMRPQSSFGSSTSPMPGLPGLQPMSQPSRLAGPPVPSQGFSRTPMKASVRPEANAPQYTKSVDGKMSSDHSLPSYSDQSGQLMNLANASHRPQSSVNEVIGFRRLYANTTQAEAYNNENTLPSMAQDTTSATPARASQTRPLQPIVTAPDAQNSWNTSPSRSSLSAARSINLPSGTPLTPMTSEHDEAAQSSSAVSRFRNVDGRRVEELEEVNDRAVDVEKTQEKHEE